MKEFFEEYGAVALGVMTLILLIVMVSPLKNSINFNLRDTVKAATQKAEKQDRMSADPTVENLNPDHTVYPITYDTLGGSAISSTEGWHLPDEFFAPVKPGYRFQGWWEDNVFTKKVVAGEQINKPTTLYAKWEAIDYTISYNLDGGTLNGQKTSYTIDDSAYTLPMPIKEGFIFEGWYDNPSFSGSPITNIPAGTHSDKAYYAKWEPEIILIDFTITVSTYDSGSGQYLYTQENYQAAEGMTWRKWANSEYNAGSKYAVYTRGSSSEDNIWLKESVDLYKGKVDAGKVIMAPSDNWYNCEWCNTGMKFNPDNSYSTKILADEIISAEKEYNLSTKWYD